MNPIDIVVPDGSMQDRIMELLAKAGLPVTMEKKRTKQGTVSADWIKRIVFQRPQEIPQYLNSGHFDLAICGQDWIANWGYEFPLLLELPIGRAGNKPIKIVLAVSQASGIKTITDLPQNCEIATEYVQLVTRFFTEKNRTDIKIIPSYGNTEHKVLYGATGIVDVTESGNSLKENKLEIIYELMQSNTAVIANHKSLQDPEKQTYIDCFVRLLKGAHQASQYVLLIANVPGGAKRQASKIIGGLKGPTCSELTRKNWYSLHAIIPKENEQKIIFELLQIGVTDIIINRDIPLIMT